MNIALFTIEFPAYAQNYILSQITGLIDRGCEIEIYADRAGRVPEAIPEIEKYRLLQKTYYFKTYSYHALSQGLYIGAMPLLRERPYDILHCQFGAMGLNVETLRRCGGISGKMITSFRGFDIGRMIYTHGRHIYDPLFENGDLFLPVSENMKQQLIEIGCPPEKIIVHPTGIDCEKFQTSGAQPGPDDKIRLISIARLVEKKGLEYSIQAAVSLSRKYNLEYQIAGDGPLRAKLQQMISDLNAGETIHLLGWKNQDEIKALLQCAHIFLAPSVTGNDGDQEGIPNVLKEAMAMGLQVISTFHSGIPELVQEGISGFLIPEKDIKALKERLIHLLSHLELWAEMGRAGRDHVKKNYTVEKLNDQLIQIYKNLCQKNDPG